MADVKPPQFNSDERATLTGLLQFQRDSIVRKSSGLDESQVRRSVVPSQTTLLWLVRHLARAEWTWVLSRFAGIDGEFVEPTIDADTMSEAIDRYVETSSRVNGVVAAAPLDECCATPEYHNLPLRWVLAHLLEETSRHAGHADIIRELLDGSTGR